MVRLWHYSTTLTINIMNNYITGICSPEGAHCWAQCSSHQRQDVSH